MGDKWDAGMVDVALVFSGARAGVQSWNQKWAMVSVKLVVLRGPLMRTTMR